MLHRFRIIQNIAKLIRNINSINEIIHEVN